VLAREATYDDCSKQQEGALAKAHARAEQMLENAADKLSLYDEIGPREVKTALRRHFGSSSWFVSIPVRTNIASLRAHMALYGDPQYDCEDDAWNIFNAIAIALPLCDVWIYPPFFKESVDRQAATLIHEWFHRYLWKLDIVYDWETDYEQYGTVARLLNADSLAEFVYDVR
jgi:hypothetical protein